MTKSRIGSAFCTTSDPLLLLYHTMMITEDGRFTVFPKFGLFFVVVVVIVKKTVQQLGRDPSSGPTERSNPLRPAVWKGDEQKLVQKTQTII